MGAVSVDGNKQKGEKQKQCDAKDVERNHPGTRKAENRGGAQGAALTI
jgi:hypothetical protein